MKNKDNNVSNHVKEACLGLEEVMKKTKLTSKNKKSTESVKPTKVDKKKK